MNIQKNIDYILSDAKPYFYPVLEQFGAIDRDAQHEYSRILASHFDANVRATALQVATELKLDLDNIFLEKLMQDTDRSVRWFSCEYVHFCKKTEHLRGIKQLLTNDIDPLVRSRAAVAMGDLGGIDDIAFLEEAITLEHGENHEGVPISSILRDSISKIAERSNPQRRD